MGARLGVVRAEESSAAAIAAYSRTALDRPLQFPAELRVTVARDSAVFLGAFQRATGLPHEAKLLRRGSGGPAVAVAEGMVCVALAMTQPGALLAGDETRIVNRAVRPLLRALGKAPGVGGLAHFFGRDWISVKHRPSAWVGFAHDSASRRTLFEAFVAVRAPFALADRPSFLGKSPGALESIVGRSLDPRAIARTVVEAYAAVSEANLLEAVAEGPAVEESDPRADPPWAATCEEAIGTLGAGPDARGRFRVGGDLLVSRDALARLEARAEAAGDAELGAIVDETLGAPGVALDGVRALTSVRDVILLARQVLRSRPRVS